MVLTLYKLDASPPARAAMMVIEYLKLKDVKFIDVNLLNKEHLSEEYLKMNPQHTVPTLKDDDFAVWDSHAIALYLLAKFGDKTLYPTDIKKRATVDQRLHFDSGILFPALRTAAASVIFMGATEFSQENLDRVLAAYDLTEKLLVKKWFAGDEFTVADICAVSTISSMDAIIPIDEKKYPKLKAWLNNFSNLEFYKKANVPGTKMFAELIKSKLA